MIGWIVKNFISREANVVLKIYKILIRPHTEYCTQAGTPVECNIEIRGHTKKSD